MINLNILLNFMTNWIDFLYTSSLFTIIVFIPVLMISKVLNKQYSRLIYIMWMLVLIRLFLPLDFALPYSGMDLLSLVKQQYVASSVETMSPMSMHYDINTSLVMHKKSVPQLTLSHILFMLWSLFTFVLVSYYALKNIQYLRLLKKSIPIQNDKLIQMQNKWQRKLKIKKWILLVTYDKDIPPFSYGMIHPQIYIPSGLIKNMSSEKLEAIIAHEMAHVKRGDFLWIRMESMIQILFFFNPIVWYVIRKRNQLRELLTDQMVLSQKILRTNHYIKCLLNLTEFNLLGSYTLRWAPGMSEKKSQLKQRILFLRGENQMKKIPIQILLPTFILIGWFVLPMTGYQMTDFTVNAKPIEIKEIDAKLQSPLPHNEITSGWGMRKDPLNNKVKLHKGVDLRSKKGADVLAAGSGVVIKAKQDYKQGVGYGKYVDIQHADGMLTRYAQLDKILVEEGQKVKAGTIIGKVGSTGRSTGPHLHFELRKDGEAVNPEEYIKF